MGKAKKETKFETGQCGSCGEVKPKRKDDYQCFECREEKDPVQARLEAAEEVCWTLLLMMALGGLEIPQEWRDYLYGSYGKWTDLAVDTGILATEEDEDEDAPSAPETREEDKEAEADSTAGPERPGSAEAAS